MIAGTDQVATEEHSLPRMSDGEDNNDLYDSDALSEESERDEDQSDDVAAPYAMDCDTTAEGGSVRPDFHVSPHVRLHKHGGKCNQSDSEEAGSPATPRILPMHLAGSASRTIGGQQKPTHDRRKGRPVVASDSDDPVDRIGQILVSTPAMQNERTITTDKARENEIVVW
jgi:hypothetical protein